MGRQGKKNAKVKDTGRVKYIAVERRTPPAVLKLPDVFTQTAELFQGAARATPFISQAAAQKVTALER